MQTVAGTAERMSPTAATWASSQEPKLARACMGRRARGALIDALEAAGPVGYLLGGLASLMFNRAVVIAAVLFVCI